MSYGNGTHGIYRLDPRTGRRELIFDDPEFHDMHAKALVPRPEPDGRSSVVNEKYPTGKLYCLNVSLTDPAIIPHMRPGMIRGLRVIEGVPLPAGDRSGSTPIVQKRLLGQVPVEEDGSFHIEVPADVPVQLQTLDANGMALRSCGWIWVKHHEPRGCIGCHEDPELTPENRFVQALRHPAMKLTLPAEKRRTVDFRRDLMPIITQKCTPCHTGRPAGLDLRGGAGFQTAYRHFLWDRLSSRSKDRLESLSHMGQFNSAYKSLLVGCGESVASDNPPGDKPIVGKYVHPGQARTSLLIWRIFGRNTSRPWDESYRPGQTFATCPPREAEQLTDDEKLTFIEWIDLGAHWDGIPGADEFSAEAGGDTKSVGGQ